MSFAPTHRLYTCCKKRLLRSCVANNACKKIIPGGPGGDIAQMSVPSLSPKGISPKVIGGPTVAGRPDRLNSKYPL